MSTTQDAIDPKVRAYEARLIRDRPNLAAYEREQLVATERRRLIQDNPGVKALKAQQVQRKQEQEAADAERRAKFERRRAAAARADLDQEMNGIRAAFIANGGTPAAWASREDAIRGDLLEERARRVAQAGREAGARFVRAHF